MVKLLSFLYAPHNISQENFELRKLLPHCPNLFGSGYKYVNKGAFLAERKHEVNAPVTAAIPHQTSSAFDS